MDPHYSLFSSVPAQNQSWDYNAAVHYSTTKPAVLYFGFFLPICIPF